MMQGFENFPPNLSESSISRSRRLKAALKFILCLAPLAAAISPALAEPNCSHSPFRLCDGCSITQTMRVKSGASCVIPMEYTFGVGRIRLTRRAAKGSAGTSSNTYAYKASSGFKGVDSFGVEIDYQDRSGSMAKTKVDVSVTIF